MIDIHVGKKNFSLPTRHQKKESYKNDQSFFFFPALFFSSTFFSQQWRRQRATIRRPLTTATTVVRNSYMKADGRASIRRFPTTSSAAMKKPAVDTIMSGRVTSRRLAVYVKKPKEALRNTSSINEVLYFPYMMDTPYCTSKK